MKKTMNVSLGLFGILFLGSVCFNQVSSQSAQKGTEAGKPIPSEVLLILEKSCTNCHSQPGNLIALTHVNLSNWGNYTLEKQANKAKAMCDELSKDDMPPRKFRKKHPEGIPTPAEIKTICDWAQSLQVAKK